MRASHQLGIDGEKLVASQYEAAGYEVLARNWRHPRGEIDLIVARRSGLVVCEVKTRSTDRFGSPACAVGPAKQARIRLLSGLWLAGQSRTFSEIRFDVAAVTVVGGSARVELIPAAF